ncbi:MAG: septum site-determining protein MinC [Nevskiales bacterium]
MSVPATEIRAVEFKGRMLTVSVLRVQSGDLGAIESELQRKLEQAGSFLREMPIVIEPLAPDLDLRALHALLRARGLMPVALLQATPEQQGLARELGLGLLSDLRAGRERPVATEATPAPEAAPAAVPVTPQRVPALLISEPVRSGQQIYARNSDLIVLAAVSAGAEVVADGNVHVYGPLRGRAIAGVQGDAQARIFCWKFAAELVAVAGCYKLIEDLPPAERQKLSGRAVQVHLQGESLKIESLN